MTLDQIPRGTLARIQDVTGDDTLAIRLMEMGLIEGEEIELIGAAPFAFSHGIELLMGRGERERIIAGERHLVLTGWDRPDYSILSTRADAVVLEIANPNVNDETLKLLLPM